jgi:hypothetical protein
VDKRLPSPAQPRFHPSVYVRASYRRLRGFVRDGPCAPLVIGCYVGDERVTLTRYLGSDARAVGKRAFALSRAMATRRAKAP